MLDCRMGFTYHTVAANDVMKRFNLPLRVRRKYFDILTLYRLVNSIIDCPDLLNEINTRYAYNSSLSRLLRSGCDISPSVNFLPTKVNSFKSEQLKAIQCIEFEA
ncbi:hypothetical protein J6590_086846 [Homalodisca vitripennis]|nr:hypothetical protein J6590_086846 [Homalodisca vitripennis]